MVTEPVVSLFKWNIVNTEWISLRLGDRNKLANIPRRKARFVITATGPENPAGIFDFYILFRDILISNTDQ